MKASGPIISAISLVMISVTAMAHHSFSAQFDINKPVLVPGIVTEMRFSNPHAWLFIDSQAEDGTVVNWAFETGAAGNVLARRGFRPSDLPPGTPVEVAGWQARNDSPTASIRYIELEDGTRLLERPNVRPSSEADPQ